MSNKKLLAALLVAFLVACPAFAGPIPPPPKTLGALGGRQAWVPICSRRGANGSAATTESTNTSVMDQVGCYGPSWGNVTAVKLVYGGFDIYQQGEVDRLISATFDTAIFQPASAGFGAVASGATTAGATTIPFSAASANVNAISVGQQIAGTGIPAGDYVTALAYTVGASNSLTTITITLAAATTANTAAGATFSFAGQFTPVTFGGARNVTLAPRHDVLTSDPAAVQIAPGARYWIRTAATMTGTGMALSDYPGAGSRIIANTAYGITYTEFDTRGTGAVVDNTLNPVAGSNSGGGFWGPVAVLGLVTPTAGAGAPGAVLVLGDSIGAGTGDVADALGLQGYIQRSLENNVPFLTLARGSITAAMVAARGDGEYSASVDTGITDVLLELGRNDIQQFSQTAAQVEASIATIAARYRNAGKRVWCFTVPPTTISNDGWSTLGNQSWIATSYTANGAVASGATSIVLSGSSGVAIGQTVAMPAINQTVGSTAAASGATTITMASTSGMYAGQAVYGAGIAAGTTIASIAGAVITLSQATTAIIPAYVYLDFGVATAPGTTITGLAGATITLSTPTLAAISSGAQVYTGTAAANSSETQRQGLNTFLRSAANRSTLGCTGLVDDDAYAADLGGSFKWRADLGSGTIDGVHPQQVVHQAIISAGAIQASMFPAF